MEEPTTKPHFVLPTIFDNPSGWGPTEESIPRQFVDVPYAPYNKGDKVGKVADFGGYSYGPKMYGQRGPKESGNAAFGVRAEDEDTAGFRLVDTHPTQKKVRSYRSRLYANWNRKKIVRKEPQPQSKPAYGGKHGDQQRRKQQGGWQGGGWQRTGNRRGGRFGGPGGGRRFDRDKIAKESSVEVKPDWEVVEQVDLTTLTKLRIDEIPEAKDLVKAGRVNVYDKSYDRVSVKQKKALKRGEKTFFKVTTADDPIIKNFSLQETFDGNVVFATDAIISLLMCSTRSQYSWDIIVRRVGPKVLFFDKRDKSQFDYLTVNETASEPPRDDDKEGINAPHKLSHEASYINQNFSQQVLLASAPRVEFPEPNPFQGSLSNEEIASVGYRYRKWEFDDEQPCSLICRCEIDAADVKQGQEEYYTVKALNEYDPKITGDWRQKLDSQRGAVLATELKNNSCKLARWTAQSLLSGSQEIKIGYVSRSNTKDPSSHVILGVQSYKPLDFASQINLNENNMWAILKHYIDVCLGLEPGTYVLLKDPNKQVVRLYKVPEDAFAEQPKDEEEDEGEFVEGEERGGSEGEGED